MELIFEQHSPPSLGLCVCPLPLPLCVGQKGQTVLFDNFFLEFFRQFFFGIFGSLIILSYICVMGNGELFEWPNQPLIRVSDVGSVSFWENGDGYFKITFRSRNFRSSVEWEWRDTVKEGRLAWLYVKKRFGSKHARDESECERQLLKQVGGYVYLNLWLKPRGCLV